MDSTNPYAPPRAHVSDVIDPAAPMVHADRGTRFAAAVLDQIIGVAIVVPFLVAAFVGVFTGEGEPDAATMATGAMITLAGSVVWCWLTIRFVLRNGQSIAKKLLGIKVVRADGSSASLGRIFWLRNVVNTLLGIVPLYTIVDALFIFGEPHQCLHDKLADTIVVKA